MLQRAPDHFARHPQIGLAQVLPAPVSRHTRLQCRLRTGAQQQKSALGAGDRERRIDHADQHFVDRERALQRARQIQDGAQFRQIAAYAHGHGRLLAAAHLLHQPLEFRAVQRKQQLIGILRAEFHAVRVLQRLAL